MRTSSRLCNALFALTLLLAARPLSADPVAVRSSQGTFHGFLALKTLDGKTLAGGDLIQVVHGDRVTSRMTFRFRDGSVDEETTVFSQRKVFKLISDHHIQRGPTFPEPLDLTIDAATGQVTSRQKDGKIVYAHFDLDPDICNGVLFSILLNLDPSALPLRLSTLTPNQKPRLAHLDISKDGETALSIAGIRHMAADYKVKIELGGIVGIVAPIIGKQPDDLHVWVLGGEAPAFVRYEGQFYEGAPIWRVDLVAPAFVPVR